MNKYGGLRNKGFTTIEILTATAILVLVICGIMALYIMYMTTWREGGEQIALQREAGMALEKMIRGAGGIRGLREARQASLNLVNSANITAQVDMNNPVTPEDPSDDTTISFHRNGNQLIYDPDISIVNNEYIIAEHLKSGSPGLAFSVNGSVVTIALGLESQEAGRTISIDLSTRVKLRN